MTTSSTDQGRGSHLVDMTGPDQSDVDELRGLLDLLESFSSNDQRARYLLTSNWMRDRGAAAADYIRRTVEGVAASTRACPDWCVNGEGCGGDHETDVIGWTSATGGIPRRSGYGQGCWFPGVTLRVYRCDVDNARPTAALHIGGEGVDAQADLHLNEARALLAALQASIAVLEKEAAA